MYFPVLRIHDILVWIWIRIWIRGSMPLTDGSGSCYFFSIDIQDARKNYFFKAFSLLQFEGTITSFFKDKKSKRSHKAVGIKIFITIFAW